MHRLLVTLVSVIVLAGYAFTQEAPLKRLGYWGSHTSCSTAAAAGHRSDRGSSRLAGRVAAAWSRTNAAALVLRGSADTVMSRADSEALFEIVNRAHPGTATYREIDGADHLFTRGAGFAGETVTTMLEWMRSQLTRLFGRNGASSSG